MELGVSFDVVGKVVCGAAGYRGQEVSVWDVYCDDLSHSDNLCGVQGVNDSYFCRVV
jgi:uncharacterized protein CbrC (UPF0167 family)